MECQGSYQGMAAISHKSLRITTSPRQPAGFVSLSDLLRQACSRGVQIAVIYDAIGSSSTPTPFFDDLERAGVPHLKFTAAIEPIALRLDSSVVRSFVAVGHIQIQARPRSHDALPAVPRDCLCPSPSHTASRAAQGVFPIPPLPGDLTALPPRLRAIEVVRRRHNCGPQLAACCSPPARHPAELFGVRRS